jgi:hypothetical protein
MGLHEGLCVSLYMPTHRAGPETRQDRIRLKNLLPQAQERLIQGGLRSPNARSMLAPAQKLMDDSAFWRHQSDGLAILLSEQKPYIHRLPVRFEEGLFVSNRFYLKPLLPLFTGDGHFYILALSQNEVRLLEATRYGVDPLDLAGVPGSLAEALEHEDLEKHLQSRAYTPGGGEGAAIFHGYGPGDEEAKERIVRFFRQVDQGVRDALQVDQAPLVLAGVGYLLPLYREVNSYPHLLEGGLTGNPEQLRPEELHKQAWEVVQPHFSQEMEAASGQYRQLAGTGRTSTNITECVPAAYHGRIEVVFVALGVQQWGVFDADRQSVDLLEAADPQGEDLLNFAALHTILNSGTVYAVEPHNVPDGGALAAVFRY